MDLEFNHPTDIYSLRPCRNTDAPDIVAIGGEHSVEVIQVASIFPSSLAQNSSHSNSQVGYCVPPPRVFPRRVAYHCHRMVLPHRVPFVDRKVAH